MIRFNQYKPFKFNAKTIRNHKYDILNLGDWMYYIKTHYQSEIEINKSRFIAHLFPVETKDDVKSHIDQLKLEFPKANHYCHAAIIGEHGDLHIASDDGEPQKTAGVPILDVLKHHELTNVCLVVIRFFGGIKLGAGGLIRAYSKSAANVVLQIKRYEKKQFDVFEISFGYHLIETIDQTFMQKATVTHKTFLDVVTYRLIFDQSESSLLEDIRHLLLDLKKLEPEIHFV